MFTGIEVPAVERRWKLLLVTPELIQDFATVGWNIPFNQSVECLEGLPKTAKFIGGLYDIQRYVFSLIFEDDSFELSNPSSPLPLVNVKMTHKWQKD